MGPEHDAKDDDEDELSKGHVREQEQAKPLGKSIQSRRLQKRDQSAPLQQPEESHPLNGGFTE
jgi:hypothetical protein